MPTIRISAKCSDTFFVRWPDGTEQEPSGLGIGSGDYLAMEIDVETGIILGWKGPTGVQDAKDECSE